MNLVGARWLARCLIGRDASALALSICAGSAGLAAGGCNLDNPGVPARAGTVSFPIALSLSQEDPPRTLFVANANYDLSYNAGSVQSYDLDELESRIRDNGCLRYDVPEADGPDGEVPDAGADADAPDAELPDADISDSAIDGDVADGDVADGEVADGEVADGEVADADVADAEVADGEVADAEIDSAVAIVTFGDASVNGSPVASVGRTNLCDDRNLSDGTRSRSDDPARCCFGGSASLRELRRSEVQVDSFASALALAPDGRHLYVPIRSKSRLVYLDVSEDGALSCGTPAEASEEDGPIDNDGVCRRGPRLDEPAIHPSNDNEGRARFPAQPTSLVVGEFAQLDPALDGQFLATTHQTGDVSLFRLASSGRPELLSDLRGGPRRAVSLTFDAPTRLFYLSSATASGVDRAGVHVFTGRDGESLPQLYRTSAIAISGLSSALDVRDVQLDQRARMEPAPLKVYALVRGSARSQIQSIVFLELPPGGSVAADGLFANVVDEVRVGRGPTRMIQTTFGGRHLLIVSCYDEGAVYVVDADSRRLIHEIPEFSGPYDMKIDPKRELLYVTDFRASVVRVVDIKGLADLRLPRPRIVATLGKPYFPGAFQ